MPRIKTTRTARIALWALRIYLLILLSLIGLKFARGVKNSTPTISPASTNAAPGQTAPESAK
jgi:hypothetical protein